MKQFIEWLLKLISYKPQKFTLKHIGSDYIYD